MRRKTMERNHPTACDKEECPFNETIGDLKKVVFVGNGTPPLTVQIGNLATKIDTTRNLVLAAFVVIPVIFTLLQWALHALGVPTHVIAAN
jgi:hypothetical protein